MNEQNMNQLKQGEEDYKKHVTNNTEFKNSIKQNETSHTYIAKYKEMHGNITHKFSIQHRYH